MIELTPYQETKLKDIKELIAANKYSVLTGCAGSSKTTLAKYIIDNYPYNVLLAATTHKAASVLSAKTNDEVKTIHSILGLVPTYQGLVRKNEHKKPPMPSLLICDESSMADSEVMRWIEDSYDDVHTKILFVGDKYQLPPVNESFSMALEYPSVELEEIYRQEKGNPLIDIGVNLRDQIRAKADKIDLSCLDILPRVSSEEAVKKVAIDPDSKILAYTNYMVDKYSLACHKEATGSVSDYFEVGERVVLVSACETYGGSLVTSDTEMVIESIKDSTVTINGVSLNGFKITTQYGEFFSIPNRTALTYRLKNRSDLTGRQKWDINRCVADIRYSYASTVHRSQGSTYKNSYLALKNLMKVCTGTAKGQSKNTPENRELFLKLLYTAITRASEMTYIIED